MEKKIEDYLHLYPKCKFLLFDGDKEIIDFSEAIIFEESICFKGYGDWYFKGENDFTIKPILRPLSDMTEEEKKEVGFDAYQMLRSEHGDRVIPSREKGFVWAAKQTTYLLKQGFDLFGLIEAGLAIDKTKI